MEHDHSPASKRVRPAASRLLGEVDAWALLPTVLHNDFKSVVLGARRAQTQRGKPIELSSERLAELDKALRGQPSDAEPPPGNFEKVSSLPALRSLAARLYVKEQFVGRDVSGAAVGRYYDGRSAEYDAHNSVAQERLTRRLLELAGWTAATAYQATNFPPPRMLLDLGSGTGLSSLTARSLLHATVVGVDVSVGMLSGRGNERDDDACAADIGAEQLPFRSHGFDAIISVSALQYLCHAIPASGLTGYNRLSRLFSEIYRTVAGGCNGVFCAQFHPAKPQDAELILQAAVASGWCAQRSTLIVDQTHHTNAQRWYIVCRRALPQCTKRQPCQCLMYSSSLGIRVQCALQIRAVESTTSGSAFADHLQWLARAHVKYARGLIRRLAYVEKEELDCGRELESCQSAVHNSCGHQRAKRRRKSSKLQGVVLCPGERELALHLRAKFGDAVTLDELTARQAEVLGELHTCSDI